MKYLLTVCLIATFTSIHGQNDTDEKLLNESVSFVKFLIPDDKTDQMTMELSPGARILETETCECVPYYLYPNETCQDGSCGVFDIRNTENCRDYLTQCCEAKDKILEPVLTPHSINKSKGCGVRNPNGVGFCITSSIDNEAQFGEFPWMVAILRKKSIDADTQKLFAYQCGGSLIHPQVVLTAAHCVAAREHYQIRAGEWDTQTRNELLPYQNRTVIDVITHPDYNSKKLFNDIALLILDSPLNIMENVDTVCLPTQDEILENTRCYTSGWGKDVFEREGKYQVILKKVDLPVIQRDLCEEQLRRTRLGKYFTLDKSFVCAGGEMGRDGCRGDGGGPLVCPHSEDPTRYFQGGIVAWGIGCGLENVPSVYANVALFRNWVDERMTVLGYGTSSYTL